MSLHLVTPSRSVESITYSLAYDKAGNVVWCSCPGFQDRNRCRHITEHSGGTTMVCCERCNAKPISGVRYDAARSFAEARGYKCFGCLDRALLVVPDWEAREAREIIRRVTVAQ